MFRSWFKTLSSLQKKGLSLLLFGSFFLFLFFSFQAYQFFQQNRLAFSQTPALTTEIKEEEIPQRIIIPQISLDLTITPAKIVNNHWQTSEEGASYLLGSGIPGQKGNVILYGHNKQLLLGPIRWLKEGEEIKIINRRGEEYIYSIVQTKTVTPETVEILAPSEEAVLTLYTCTGFLDRERWVIVAQLHSE